MLTIFKKLIDKWGSRNYWITRKNIRGKHRVPMKRRYILSVPGSAKLDSRVVAFLVVGISMHTLMALRDNRMEHFK